MSPRITTTPNATMTTLASPTSGSDRLSVWQVSMEAGARGPLHAFDSEQVWTVLAGTVRIERGDEVVSLEAGDALVLPGSVTRRVHADTDARLMVCGYGDAIVSVPGEDGPRGTPDWIR